MIKSEFIPTLPLRDIVVFPAMIIPLFVGRDKSIKSLNEVMKTNKKIILITQKNAEIDDPNVENLYSYGCESKILQLLKLPDGTVKVLAEGVNRVKILECKDDSEYLASSVEIVKDKRTKEPAPTEALKICYGAWKRGLLFITVGTHGNVFEITPPLIITREEVDKGLEIMNDAFTDVEKGRISDADISGTAAL